MTDGLFPYNKEKVALMGKADNKCPMFCYNVWTHEKKWSEETVTSMIEGLILTLLCWLVSYPGIQQPGQSLQILK